MVDLTQEQKRALAVAKARKAATQAQAGSRDPVAYGGDDAFRSGLVQGATFGFGDELLAGMMTPIEMGIDAFQGKPFDIGRSFGQALDRNRGTDRQMQEASPALATAGNLTGAVGTGMGLAKGGVTLMAGAKPTIASMGLRGAAEGAAYGGLHGLGTGEGLEDKVHDALWGAAIGGGFGGALGAAGGAVAGGSARKAAGTAEQLKGQAGSLYESARQSGAVLPQKQSAAMADSMRQIASSEGIITPLGRINDSYQKVSALIRSFDDYGQGPLTVDQMQSVRRLIGNALKSTDADERRIAMAMMDEFHRFLDPIAPQIAQANGLYHRAMNAERLGTLVEVAEQKAKQYGRSLDATLREQFGALQRQIIKGEVKGFSPGEIAAINKVAEGGPIENVLRLIGKAAPSGLLSGATSFGGPLAVGTLAGNPVAGAAVGAGLAGTGMAARAGASAMTNNSARNAVTSALLAGQPAPSVSPAIGSVTQALIAAEGNQAPRMPSNTVRAFNGR